MILPYSRLITSSEAVEIVYLAAPIHTFHEPEYDLSVKLIRARHPNATSVLLSRDLFDDSRDFVLTYRDKLYPVNTLYVLPDRNLRIGAGVHTEYEFLKHVSPNCREMLAFNPSEGLRLYSDFTLEPLSPAIRTMREFARVTYFQEGR